MEDRRHGWLLTWFVLLTAVAIAGAAGYGIFRIHAYASGRAELRVLLGNLQAVALQQSALEWQAVAEDRVSPSLAQERLEADRGAYVLADRLRALDSTSIQAQQVQSAFSVYDVAVDDEFALLESGQAAEAEEVDEQRVDPAFERLAERLQAANDYYADSAALATRRADRGTQLILLAASVVIGLLVWQFQRTQSEAVERVAYQSMRHQAMHDGLTGLPNRILLHDRSGQAIRQADRDLSPAALLLIDLDRFKEVNDTLGHRYGDHLLIEVGKRLVATVRAVDTVSRLGGDEFVILLPGIVTSEGAVAVAQKLQAALEEPFEMEGLTLDVEASMGIALYPDHASDPDELLQRADIAMYAAKASHVGYVLFDASLDQHSPRRLALLGELRHAIDKQQLILHYQPKVDARTGQVLGVEALVRWQHSDHGLIPPSEFIPIAERTGLIVPLTHYVLNEALRQCSQWRQEGHDLSVAVNVSARRLLDLRFPDEVAGLLAAWEVPSRLLVVEITESTIMADPDHARQILGRLDEMGVQLSIDDFGTGYSSMSYLKNLPVQELKVDQSFVSQMTHNNSDAVIVQSTVDLGRNLGLRVVAEGVEDLTTWQQLEALGCDGIQGYYVSRPIPAHDLLAWLGQQRMTPYPPTKGVPGREPAGGARSG